MKVKCLTLLLGVILVFDRTVTADVINKSITNTNVERSIDISSQLCKVINKITLSNSGKDAVQSYLFALCPTLKEKLSYISAQSVDSSRLMLKSSETKVSGINDKIFWKIDFKEALQPGKSITIEIETVFTHELVPHPTHITQKEKQFISYSGNHYFYSPYDTVKQTTMVNVGVRSVESYTKLKPVSYSGTTITYGPYEQIPAYSYNKMTIHYENNSPFLTITNLERVIEVSHWGNIAIEESIDLLHTGAVLKGPFSRYEYQRESQSGLSSIKSFKTILPAAASDAYYRDEIGNISTSHMKVLSDSVELDLMPRFPLFGGWKTHYVIGYNVPSYEYLYNKGDNYLLKMRLLDHVFDDMVVDKITTKIILPEGSSHINLKAPYSVQQQKDSVHFTYLDTKGRPVVTVKKSNLVENHIQDFELHYTFPRILMLQEPLLVVAALYLLFLLVIVYVRLDFSITKDEAEESRMKMAGTLEKIISHQDARTSIYRQIEAQLAKLKSTKDVNSFQSTVKALNQEHKTETGNIGVLLIKVKNDGLEIADKIQELQKTDKFMKEVFNQYQSLYLDKLIPNKINRQAFVEAENNLNRKKEESFEKINSIVKSLH